MRAALYCRVSSDSQREKQTIETQKRILADYVKAQQWEIVDWYVDDGITGTSIEARPEFTRLLREAEEGQFDVVVIVDIDRLTRSDDPRQRALIEYILRQNGIKVAVTNTGELLDFDNPNHELVHTIKTWIAKEDRKRILQRMAEGRKTKALQGKFLNSRPSFGYRKDDSSQLIIDESEAKAVREIFRLYTEQSISMNDIALRLDVQGCLRRNGARWTPGRISQTIKNPIYKGELFVNREKGGVPLDPSKWIRIEVPPIVTADTWDAAQRRALANKTFAKRRTKKEYLLRGLVYCGECGSKLTAKTYLYGGRKPYSKYLCYKREHKKRTGGCVLPSLPSKAADAVVWDLVMGLVKDPKVLKRVIGQSNQQDTRKEIAATIEDLDKRLHKVEMKKNRLIRLYLKGELEEREIELHLSEIRTAEEMLTSTKRIEEKKLAALKLGRQQVESLEKALAGLREGIDDFTFEQRQRLVRLIVPGDREHRIHANVDRSLTLNGVIDFSHDQASEKSGDLSHYSALLPARRY